MIVGFYVAAAWSNGSTYCVPGAAGEEGRTAAAFHPGYNCTGSSFDMLDPVLMHDLSSFFLVRLFLCFYRGFLARSCGSVWVGGWVGMYCLRCIHA